MIDWSIFDLFVIQVTSFSSGWATVTGRLFNMNGQIGSGTHLQLPLPHKFNASTSVNGILFLRPQNSQLVEKGIHSPGNIDHSRCPKVIQLCCDAATGKSKLIPLLDFMASVGKHLSNRSS